VVTADVASWVVHDRPCRRCSSAARLQQAPAYVPRVICGAEIDRAFLRAIV
jgi:hypothetical protein